jgi:chromosome segregation ATPase
MTPFGKILVVIHLVLSIVFMAFAGAVYTAQSNWMKKATDAKKAEDKAKSDYANLQAEADRERTAARQKEEGLQDQIKQLTGEKNSLQQENAILAADNKQLKTALDGQRELARLNGDEANERIKEAMLQREKNSQLYQSRNEVIAELKALEDKVFALELQRQQFEEKYAQLLRENATMKTFLASKQLPTDTSQMMAGTQPPTDVDGIILEARKAERGGNEFVEISLGSDDDLRIGHMLTVYNQDRYLGRIRIIRVTPDRAVGLVVEKAKNSVIQRGDHVTTKL